MDQGGLRHAFGRPRVAVAALLASALAGCSGSGASTSASQKATPSTAAASAAPVVTLAGALQLEYANRYVDADRAFVTLTAASPKDPQVHAAYALFLNYRQDFSSALREATLAIGDGPTTARAYAVLCRVHDWSNRLEEAVTAGSTAVRLDAGDTLAHLFLSEALADHGDLSASKAELDAAQRLLGPASPAYERAELHREAGNLAHDDGDTVAELSAYKAAFQAQPDWVERPTELASAYLDNSDLRGAHGALQSALALAPADVSLLSSVARVSLLQADYGSASDALGKLVALLPDDSAALELDAHTAMAARQDVGAAVGLLQRSLQHDPANAEAAAYLVALERQVRGDEARGRAELAAAVGAAHDDLRPGRTISAPDIDAIQAAHRARALATLNSARAAAGLPAVTIDARLTSSALSHCFYWLFNNGSASVAKLGIHQETAGLPAFTGRTAGERALHFGWRSGGVGEDITHRGDPELGVRDWLDSVYHRFPMMRPDLGAIGFADCGVGPLPMEDMEFGFSAPDNGAHAPVAYPAAGQTGVPAVFVDNELPDPVPAGKPRTTGYPVTVTFDALSAASVSSFTLTDASGKRLDAYLLAPGADTENSASLLPVAPLVAGARYTAHLTGSSGGKPVDMTWSFVVAAS